MKRLFALLMIALGAASASAQNWQGEQKRQNEYDIIGVAGTIVSAIPTPARGPAWPGGPSAPGAGRWWSGDVWWPQFAWGKYIDNNTRSALNPSFKGGFVDLSERQYYQSGKGIGTFQALEKTAVPLAITNNYSAFGLWIDRNGNVTSNGAFAAGRLAVDTPNGQNGLPTNISFNGSALGWSVFPHATHNVDLIQGTTLINVDFAHYMVTHMRILLPNMVLTGDNGNILSPTGQSTPNTFEITLTGTLNGQRYSGKGLGFFFGPDGTETVVVFEVRPIASSNQPVVGTKESLVVDGAAGAAIAPPKQIPCDTGEPFEVNKYMKLLNQYWADQFAEAARQGLVSDQPWRPALYKQGGEELGYSSFTIWSGPLNLDNLDYLGQKARKFGAFAAIIGLAHEFGHHVQAIGGRRGIENRELDADRLAGAFLGALQHQGRLGSCDVVVAIRGILDEGDIPFTGPDHGTPEQRANAVIDGFLDGPVPFIRPFFPPNPTPVPGSGF